MDLKCDDIKKYIVKVKYYNNGKMGSGIIVKPDNSSDICYVLTSKHTFGDKNVKKEEINLASISICKHHINNFRELICYDFIVFNDTDDLVILFLEVKKNNLENLDQISILNHDFKYCIVAGYPQISEGESKCYECTHDKRSDDDDKASYQVLSSQPFQTFEGTELQNIGGLSGGGVFTKGSDDKYYLVGIETAIKLPQNFVCLDLRELAEKINKCLPKNGQINLEGYSYAEKIGIAPALLDFDSIKSELNNKCIEQIKNKEPAEQLEYIKDNNSDFKNFHKRVKSDIKTIADTYLYRSILFHEYGDNRRATNNFKKAVEIDPSYEAYFADAILRRKHQNTKELQIEKESLVQLEKRCQNALKTETVEEDNESKLTLLHNLKSIFLKKLTLVSDKQKQLEIYNELIKIFLDMLNIYSNDEENASHNIEKANIFNMLARLHIEKEEYDIAKNYLQKSLKLSSNHVALTVNIYNNLAKVNDKLGLYKAATKYYQKNLVLYKHLQKKDNAYTEKIIFTLNKLAVVIDKLDKEDIIDVERYYSEAFDNLKLLDKDSKIFRKLQSKTENNFKKHRKNLSNSRQIKKLTEEIIALRSSVNDIVSSLANKESLKSEEKPLESDAHVDNSTDTLSKKNT